MASSRTLKTEIRLPKGLIIAAALGILLVYWFWLRPTTIQPNETLDPTMLNEAEIKDFGALFNTMVKAVHDGSRSCKALIEYGFRKSGFVIYNADTKMTTVYFNVTRIVLGDGFVVVKDGFFAAGEAYRATISFHAHRLDHSSGFVSLAGESAVCMQKALALYSAAEKKPLKTEL